MAGKASSHYFWASDIKTPGSTVTDEAHMELVSQAFDVEDGPMLEAVQCLAMAYLVQILIGPIFVESVSFQCVYPKTPALPVLTSRIIIVQHTLHHDVSRLHIQVHELSY